MGFLTRNPNLKPGFGPGFKPESRVYNLAGFCNLYSRSINSWIFIWRLRSTETKTAAASGGFGFDVRACGATVAVLDAQLVYVAGGCSHRHQSAGGEGWVGGGREAHMCLVRLRGSAPHHQQSP